MRETSLPSERGTLVLDGSPHDLSAALEVLLPALFSGDHVTHEDREALRSFLQRFYLFEVGGLTLTDDVEDAWRFVQEQFRTALSAAQLHGLTVATVLTGHQGRTRLYVGVQATKEGSTAFRQTLSGVLPGLHVRADKPLQFDRLLQDKPFGGTISGVPTLRTDDERQRFSLGNVARAVRGSSFTLAIVSRPVEAAQRTAYARELLDVRDWCHERAKVTVGEQRGGSETHAKNASWNWGVMPFGVGGGKGGGSSKSETKQFVDSLSLERQDGLAVELEQVADHHLQRLKRAANVGYWETSVAFAAESQEAARLLAGAFAAELAKPNELGIPPRVTTCSIPDGGLLPLSLASEAGPGASSFITSEELALISAPPEEALPGYEVRRMPRLSLSDPAASGEAVEGQSLGAIMEQGTRLEAASFVLSSADLAKHVFVCGLTGSGKSTTVKQLLKSAYTADPKRPLPFLVLESAKRDYRQLLADPVFEESLRIYTVGDATVAPLRLNPFFVLPGASVAWHLDFLKALFQASFSFYGPMPAILEKCLGRIYTRRGWDLTLGVHPHLHDSGGEPLTERFYTPEGLRCFPILDDLKREVDGYIRNDLQYQGELSDNIRTAMLVRLDSLCSGAKGLMLNTYETARIEDLLAAPTVLELEPLADDDDKAFLVGLVLMLVSEYRQLSSPAVDHRYAGAGLRHVLVLEEAHRLLKNVATERQSEMMGNPKGKAVETFCNVVAEMRALGQGVVVVEQVPAKIAPDVIKNTNTKIAHRIVSGDDQALLASTLGLTPAEASYLSLLETGRALCHKEGMGRPVEVSVRSEVADGPIVHTKVRRHMQPHAPSRGSLLLPAFSAAVRPDGVRIALRLLNTMLSADAERIAEALGAVRRDLATACARSGVRYDPEAAHLFLLDEMLNMIGHGIYSRRFVLPERISEYLDVLLREAKTVKTALTRVRELMASQFETGSSRELVVQQVSGLLLARAAQSSRRMTDADLAVEARSLFYHDDRSLIADVVAATRHHLEGLYARA